MKAEVIEQAPSQLGTARKGEGMLVVVQDNQEKSLIISSMNRSVEQLLGYEPGEVIGRKLETILSQKTALALTEDLEFTADAPDFGDIFQRQRDVRLRQRSGEEVAVNCTLTRMMASGMNACFQLVFPNDHEQTAARKLREFISLNLDGRKEIDEATGLPNHKTAKEFLPLLETYLAETNMNVVFALVRLDRHQKSLAKYGKDACAQLLMHAYHCCRSTFRAEDLIFALSDHTLGVVLFDISRESSRVVLNRLRWKVSNYRIDFGGKPNFTITTCIGFDMLSAKGAEEVFERCEKVMQELDPNERNTLVELGNA
ncbi:MAG: diguanylate cyclase [Pseudomonadota bacterium]